MLDSYIHSRMSFRHGIMRTLQWATAVAVFFLPKHWTLWGALMIAVIVSFREAGGNGAVALLRVLM